MSISEAPPRVPPPVTVALSGDIDVAAIDEVRATLQSGAEAACQAGTRMDVDLSAVTFMDSTGLNSLLGIALLLDRAGVGLVLRSVPPGVARILDLSGIGSPSDTGDVVLAPLT